jgi:hypothetical protein
LCGEVAMKKRVLYIGDEQLIWDVPSNAGIIGVLANRARLSLTIADTRGLPKEQVKDTYFRAAASTAKTKHQIRNVFSSNRGEPGAWLGQQVPAMVVFADDGTVEDVFPHLDRGKYVTIAEALGI